MVATEPFSFKFKFINNKGQETGFRRQKGCFDGEVLTLGNSGIPAAMLTNCEVRDNRMAVGTIDKDGNTIVIVISAAKSKLAELKLQIDAVRSVFWAKQHQEQLAEQGRSDTFRSKRCPNCNATIILTNMPDSPQLYCHFCDSLSTHDATSAPENERDYRLCDTCGMFSKPRRFTVLYFYFLLVVYGGYQKITWRCPACMRGEAWKMLAGNLLFVLGVPVAITQLIRSYGGEVTGPFAGLNAANLKARKKDVAGALHIYRAITDRVPYCAGIKYNLGMALLETDHIQQAAEAFQVALQDCSNYNPAYGGLIHCYEKLGLTDEIRTLNEQWGVEDDAADESCLEP